MGCSESIHVMSQPSRTLEYSPGEAQGESSISKGTPNNILRAVLHKSLTQYTHQLLNISELQRLYIESGGNVDTYFSLLEEKVSDLYLTLSKVTLQNMSYKSFTNNESKVFISEEILSANLNILKVIGENNEHQYDVQNFRKLNRMQRNLIGYLKSKYPRSGQSFVPGDLMKVFKGFSMVEHPKNDILSNAGIYFGDPHIRSITKTVKLFINKIITEVDQKFPYFEKLMQEEVFAIDSINKSSQKSKQSTNINVNYKIGRKIPQNIAKYTDLNTNLFQIRDPQIFRVITKWVSDMEDFLKNPQQQIEQKETFKVVTHQEQGQPQTQGHKTKIEFSHVNAVEIQLALSQMQQLLKDNQMEYLEEVDALLTDMDFFNSNLLRILGQGERIEKYVPKKEAEVIKYAMFNTKLLSWMLAQKLILVLKRLITIGMSFENTEHMLIFDLIKFNVTDLMRAMVLGNRKQILLVYQNMRRLQQKGQIKIIKLKNRLATPMNDAMIIFTIKDSFLICQLQLILADGTVPSTSKLRSIQTLNHFLYQLERSPYGVQSQLAVVLGYKDSKIKYYNKINYEQSSLINIQTCQTNHPESLKIVTQQMKPFICSKCTTFYEPMENLFIMKVCKKCNWHICHRCYFEKFPKEEITLAKEQLKEMVKQEVESVFTRGKKNISKQSAGSIIGLYLDALEFSSITKLAHLKDKKSKNIKSQVLTSIIQQKIQLNQQLTNYLYLIQFKTGERTLKFLKYSNEVNQIHLTGKSRQDGAFQKALTIGQYDFIVFMKKLPSFQQKILPLQFSKSLPICLFSKQFRPENCSELSGYNLGKFIVVIDFKQISKGRNRQLADIQQYELSYKKTFKYDSIAALREKMPDVRSTRSIYDLSQLGVEEKFMSYFESVKWKDEIKEINLAKNKLASIQIILQNLLNLQSLYVSQNFITKVIFLKKLPHLKIMNASFNRIQQFSRLQSIPKITRLSLQSNKLTNLSALPCPKLKHLNLNTNQIGNLDILFNSDLPALSQLLLNYSSAIDKQHNLEICLNYPKLKNITLVGHSINSIKIMSSFLERVTLGSNGLQKVEFVSGTSRLKYLNLSSNALENVDFLLCENNEIDQLQTLNLQFNKVKKLGLFKAEKMKVLDFYYNEIESLEQLQNSYLPNLETLNCRRNMINKLVNIPSKKLKQFNFDDNQNLSDLSCLQDAQYPQLTIICLDQCPLVKSLPKLKLPSLTNIACYSCGIQDLNNLQQSHLPKLQLLSLGFCQKLYAVPQLRSSSLTSMDLSQSNVRDLSLLSRCDFPRLETLNLSYLIDEGQTQRSLPTLSFKSLKTLQAMASKFTHISQLANSSLPSLQLLSLSQNQIQKMPVLDFPKLITLNLAGCSLAQISSLAQSSLPSLTNLNLGNNQIQSLPIFDFPKLVTLQIQTNKIENLDQLRQSNLQNLLTLTIHDNKLTKLAQISLPLVQNLDFSGNPVSNIEQLSEGNLPKLKFLTLSYSTQATFSQIPPLHMLSLQQISFVSVAIKDFSGLTKSTLPALLRLNFSYNKIQALSLLSFPTLEYIQLTSNQIEEISLLREWNCPKLQNINLSYNNIKKIPQINFPALSTLNLTFNKIEDAKELENSQYNNMYSLDMSNNNINEIPLLKYPVSSLSIHNNPIKDISVISKCASIEYLILQNAVLGNLPPFDQKSFITIHMNTCQITGIQDFASFQYPRLTGLSLRQNKISKLPKLSCPNLQSLELSQNQISDLSLLIQSTLPQLTYLCIDSNALVSIPQLPFKSLQSVDFSTNKISTLDAFLRSSLLKLTSLSAHSCQLKSIALPANAQFPLLSNIALQKNFFESMNDTAFLSSQLKVNFPSLYSVNLAQNKIKTLGKLPGNKMQYLSDLSFWGNPIEDGPGLEEFLKSKVQSQFCYMNYTIINISEQRHRQINEQFKNIPMTANYHTMEGEMVELDTLYAKEQKHPAQEEIQEADQYNQVQETDQYNQDLGNVGYEDVQVDGQQWNPETQKIQDQ